MRDVEDIGAAADWQAMGVALEEARLAGEAGEVPVGAVVVRDGRVVARAGNERERSGDPTAHAEILALRRAAAAGPAAPSTPAAATPPAATTTPAIPRSWRLTDATLYVTLEPCPMCAGALIAARVKRVVFAAPDPKAGACGSLYNLCADPRLNHELPVVAGVRAEEAAEALSTWFAAKRDVAPQ